MYHAVDLTIAFLIAVSSTFLLVFPVKKLAVRLKIVDFPNDRKIHKQVTPRLGGLAIFIGVVLGALYLRPSHEHLPEITLGAFVIIATGMIDDRFGVRPAIKLTGQLIAASFLLSSGLIIEKITLPFLGMIDLGFFSVLITVLWVVGVTNAINLIDGLDGLATGVTTIALICIFVMAIIDARYIVQALAIVMIGANLGFLPHNFYPAKIYMGDTGSNFLGYMVAVVSMLGLFKNITLFSFIISIIILAIPIFDTLFAIVRRAYNRQSIMKPDRKHVHYQLIDLGYSHRQTVLIIYVFSALFGVMGILFSEVSRTLSIVIAAFIILLLHLFAEISGIVFGGRRPLSNLITKPFRKKPKQNQDN